MLALILCAVFLAVLLIILSAYAYINREALASREAARERLRPTWTGVESSYQIIRPQQRSSVPLLDLAFRNQPVALQLEQMLNRSGLSWSVGEFVLGSLLSAMICVYLGQFWGWFGGVLGGVAGLALPLLLVRHARTRYRTKIEAQLPAAVDMIVNGLRAGFSVPVAMQFVGDELPAPLGTEFTRFSEEQRLGTDIRVALIDLQERIGTLDAKMLITALLLQRESGGNLTDVLLGLGNTIRARVALRERITTLTAEPRASATILGLLPIVTFGLMYLLRPEFMRPLVITTTGHWFLGYAAVSVTLGTLVLRKMADIEL